MEYTKRKKEMNNDGKGRKEIFSIKGSICLSKKDIDSINERC